MTLVTDEVRAMVGREVTYTAPEELGRASIRYFARAVGDDNPLYIDDDFARAHGLASVIAPPTLLCETNQYADLPQAATGYAGHEWNIDIPGTQQYRGGNRYEFFQPVCPTDVITVQWRLEDIEEKTTSTGSTMVTVTSVARFFNQQDTLLATNAETMIFVQREPAP